MQTRSFPLSGTKTVSPWMLSRRADICCFFLPVLLGLALFFLSQSALVSKAGFWAAVLAFGMAIGPFHQGPTLFTYFDKDNRNYYLSSGKNIFTFLVMPPVLVLTSITAAFACPLALMIVVSLWHIQHLVQQNIRVLDIYHGQNLEVKEAIPKRELTAVTQWAAAIVCTLVSCSRTNFVGLQFLPGLNILIVMLSFWLLWRCAEYLLDLNRQIKAGAALNVPALGLWTVGIFSMVPVACLGKDFYAPFVVPLMIHWIQFIGMNIYLVKRKSAQGLKTVPGPNPVILLLGFSLAYTLFYVFIQRYVDPASNLDQIWKVIGTVAIGGSMGLGMCHYFLDTYIWRFDHDFQKEAFLPFWQCKE